MLEDMGRGGEEAASGAGERVVSKPVKRASASVLARRAAAPGSSHRQGCAETPPQRDVHDGTLRRGVQPGNGAGLGLATRAREKKFERRESRGAAIHLPGARVRVPQGWGVGEEGG